MGENQNTECPPAWLGSPSSKAAALTLPALIAAHLFQAEKPCTLPCRHLRKPQPGCCYLPYLRYTFLRLPQTPALPFPHPIHQPKAKGTGFLLQTTQGRQIQELSWVNPGLVLPLGASPISDPDKSNATPSLFILFFFFFLHCA